MQNCIHNCDTNSDLFGSWNWRGSNFALSRSQKLPNRSQPKSNPSQSARAKMSSALAKSSGAIWHSAAAAFSATCSG